MTILRTLKTGLKTTVSNDFIEDKRLSATAKGIMLYMESRPVNCLVTPQEICEHMADDIESIKSGLNELIQFGYLPSVEG